MKDACYNKVKSAYKVFPSARADYKADQALAKYFATHHQRIEKNWFNILTPSNHSISELKEDLQSLADKKI